MWAAPCQASCFLSTESPALLEVQSQGSRRPALSYTAALSLLSRARLSGGAQPRTPFLTPELGNSSVSFQQFFWWTTACQEHGQLTISRSTSALSSVSLLWQQESRDPGQSTCRCQERITAKMKLTLQPTPTSLPGHRDKHRRACPQSQHEEAEAEGSLLV